MDNEAIVDQIVRSLSFEVVAVPQNVVQVDSTSKSTPLNVKIRVRKKRGAELRHGVLSMPKVDTKSDIRKNEAPERIRLVSSDQTIMNFNVLMEADFDKAHPKQNLNIISPDLQLNNEENQVLSRNGNNFHTTTIYSKKNKDIFGKCKPGGCLDPPFGEDKYSYQPTQLNVPLPVKDDTAKLRSSSIFKNNIFKRRKKSSQADDELNKSEINDRNDLEFKTKSNEKGSHETYSPYTNSIITYPHPTNSNEFHKQEEKKCVREEDQSYKKRYSSDDKSKSSSVDNGSYFVVPKKTRNLSTQSDLSKTKKSLVKPSEDNINIIQLREETNFEYGNQPNRPSTESSKNVNEKRKDGSNLISQLPVFIPIPVPVPFKTKVNTKQQNDKMHDINSAVENINKEQEAMDNNNYFDESITDNVNNNLNLTNGTDFKSHPLLPDDREDARLDVNTDDIREIDKEKYQYAAFSSDELNQIWKNDTDALKSMADVITKSIISSEKNGLVTDSNDKFQHLPLKSFSDNETVNEEYSNNKNTIEKSAGDNFNQYTDDKNINEQYPQETIPEKDVQTDALIPPSTQNAENGVEDKPKKESLKDYAKNNEPEEAPKNGIKSIEHTQSNASKTYTNEIIKDSLHQGRFDENFEKLLMPKDIEDDDESTGKVNKTTDNINPDKKLDIIVQSANVIDENEATDSKVFKKETTDTATDQYDNSSSFVINRNEQEEKQNNVSDDFHGNKIEDINKTVSKRTSSTSLSGDDNVTVKGLFAYKKSQSVSDQSIIGSESLTYMAANTSGKQENDYLNINSSSDFPEIRNVQHKQEIILDDKNLISATEKSDLKKKPERMKKTGELSFGLDKKRLSSQHLPEVLHKASNASQVTSALRKGLMPWKIDIALQSYIDENNERVIKSFNSTNVPDRRPNDAFLTAQCYLENEFNEIKIPIDHDNDLSVKVINVKSQQRTVVEFENNSNSTNDLIHRKKVGVVTDKFQTKFNNNGDLLIRYEKKKIKIDVPDLDEMVEKPKINEELSKTEANRYKDAIMSGDIRNALNSIYEEELVPLQGLIKGVREEIDALIAFKMKFNMQNVGAKRSKPSFKLTHANKKCCCCRRI